MSYHREWKYCLVFMLAIPHLFPACRGETQVISHRGFPTAPENTIPAILHAIGQGCDIVEVDVRLTRDQRAILMHDPSVDRTTTGRGEVAELSFRQIRQFDAGIGFSEEFAGTPVPSLEEVLEAVEGRIGVYLDLKVTDVEKIVTLVQRAKAPPQIYYRTYLPHLAEEIRRLDSAAPIILSLERYSGNRVLMDSLFEDIPGLILTADLEEWDLEAVSYTKRLGQPVFIDLLGRRRSEKDFLRAIDFEPVAIQTDQPARLLRLLNREKGTRTPKMKVSTTSLSMKGGNE